MRLERFHVKLVLPFEHAFGGPDRGERLRRLLSGPAPLWGHWWNRLAQVSEASSQLGAEHLKELDSAISDSYFVLPYVRGLLFPDAVLATCRAASLPPIPDDKAAAPADGRAGAALLRELNRDAGGGLWSEVFPDHVVLRLTRQDLNGTRWWIEPRQRGENHIDGSLLPFTIRWVDALLFPQRTGFISVAIEFDPVFTEVKLFAHFLDSLRIVHPYSATYEVPLWHREGRSDKATGQTLVNVLLRGLVGSDDIPVSLAGDGAVQQAINSLRRRYSDTDFGQVYGHIFSLFTESRLLPEGKEDLHELDRTLFSLSTCRDTTADGWRPDEATRRQLMDEWTLRRWSDWRGVATPDHVLICAVEKDWFTEHVLPGVTEGDYFSLQMLAHFQKIRLSLLLGELVRHDSDVHRNVRETRRVLNDFMMFQNRYWFTEVTRKPQGNEVYAWLRRANSVEVLHGEVESQIGNLHAHFERQAERHTARFINFVTLVGLPAGLVVGIFGPQVGESLLSSLARVAGEEVSITFASALAILVGIVLVTVLSRVFGRVAPWLERKGIIR